MTDPKTLLRRYLRQRGELGEHDLLLDQLSAAELTTLLADVAARPAPPPPLAETAAPGAPAPHLSPASPLLPQERAAGAVAPGVTDAELIQLGSLDALREVALGCPRCRLAETRTHVVFGEGSPTASVVVVGEAPGADEDRNGRPVVGRAGKLLDLLLASIGLSREAVYICNVLKCRPPGNRNPQPDEIAACTPYLLRQIALIAPQAILAIGTFPAQTLLGTKESIGRLRGTAQDFQGVPLVATYHPAALLRNSSWVRPVWEDLQRLRAILDGQ
jgi:DNA polymerase